ncbi:MBL fold metallo-hydrolase [Anaeromyxobacter oryzae]|uniref:MBL fold metallo-hydrolase n=1 Tax=Anaeromyxobacter oryzae TaxID=2918170 RepID=A0ABM7WT12_9BACT|nr:MBL fold metallo-hydrolase [Anaeromyxobacter oryzae]
MSRRAFYVRPVRIGRWELSSLVDARFALDGGAVFGVVPRPEWERASEPDARNRVALLARCLLAVDRDARRVVLVDVGPGDKWEPARAERHALDRSAGGLDAALARHGLRREHVTDVVLTHLHLHHAGGVTRRDAAGHAALAFPRATHHVQRRHWAWAHGPSDRDGPSFLPEDFDVLGRSDRLHLVEGEAEILPDVELVVSEGHTVAQQLPRFHGDQTHLTFCGDLVPTRAHLEPSWIMAFDLQPVTTLEEKKVVLAEALEDDGIIAFGHDPNMAACRLREEEGHPVFREQVEL